VGVNAGAAVGVGVGADAQAASIKADKGIRKWIRFIVTSFFWTS